MKAWQRAIRERKAGSDGDLLGRWWDGIETCIHSAQVRPINRLMAEKVILEYEWLGTMPAVSMFQFGIFFGDVCGGVVVYSPEYAENLGVWDRYGYTGKIITLSRGACVHWAHPHSASKLIRHSMKLLPKKYEIVTATVDAEAGEIGTIYQACGFHYVGAMADRNAKQPRKCLLLPNGERVTERQARQSFGSVKAACAKIPGSSRLFLDYKGRYFSFRGDRRVQRSHYKAISHLITPYPRRQGSEASASSNEEARFDPALPLHHSQEISDADAQ